MATLNDILVKDISREIDGVIKADDLGHVLREVDEYVLTREVASALEKVIEGYNESIDYTAGRRKDPFPFNGVWISGYFGSGKSHLLKILSFLLANEKQDHTDLKDIFLPKIKTSMFKGNFEKALNVPSTSILFNIDQQADAARAGDENAILYIFEKVFNRMLGYSAENRGIASFERHLDEEGAYEGFKEHFLSDHGTEWEAFRSRAFGIGRKKVKQTLAAFRGLSEEEADGQIEHYKKETELSVDGFAGRVKTWLDAQKTEGHRLNFFIDEVGQFIADKVRLMLNLQTITETLNTACGGRVWIFVTSQEDLNSVVGDPSRNQTNDFSKIHARFKFRISLSSKNVEEVIQKRLLEKTEEGREPLGALFMKERDTFKTLFSFRGGWKEIHFKEKEQFVNSYPFQAYQYPLLQEALKGLSVHNAFMGRHVSRGERSMLEIFQDVGKVMKDQELYRWATFDMMFEGIRNTLKTSLLDTINTAENHLSHPLAVKVLKILLLVKYVNEFKATAENIQTLLIEDLDTPPDQLNRQVQEALDLLFSETYIQRNGNEFQYLTDEEQDIENEIKNTSVEISEIREFYHSFLFNDVIKSSKIRYDLAGEDYAFKKAVDDEMPRGTGNVELVLRIITPEHPNYQERQFIINQAAGKKEMLIFLEPGSRFVQEVRLYHKTSIFLRQQTGHDASGQIHRILDDKKEQNFERKKALEKDLREIAGKADIYLLDQPVALQGAQARDRIVLAFQKMVTQFYPNLRMIKEHYNEGYLQKILNPVKKDQLFTQQEQIMDEDEQEMYGYISRKIEGDERITISSLYNQFSGGQYGWYDMAIACVTAKLYLRGAVEVREGEDLKDREDLFNILSRRRDLERYSLKLAPLISDDQIRLLKEFYQEYFYSELKSRSAKDAGTDFKTALVKFKENLYGYIRQKGQYPFVESIEPAAQKINDYTKKSWEFFLTNVEELEEELLQDKVEVLDKFLKFMGREGEGDGLHLWQRIQKFHQEHRANFDELSLDGSAELLEKALHDPMPYKGNTLRQAGEALAGIEEKEKKLLEKVKEEAKARVQELVDSVTSIPEYAHLDPQAKEELLRPLKQIASYDIDRSKLFSEVRDRVSSFGQRCVEDARKTILELSRTEEVRYATREELRFAFQKRELSTPGDVEAYVQALKSHYLKLINENKRIGL